jgi:cardiolipin synthase C
MRRRKGLRLYLVGLLFLMCVYTGACASIPFDYPKTPSSALPPSNQTRLWNGLNSQSERHAGQSGFFLIPSGMDAFLSRYFLIEAADRTLDLQYYMFHDDTTGMLLMERIIAAANRGVRVRLLFDDWNIAGEDFSDFSLSMFSAHPNIKVRVFNPFGGDRSSALSRLFQSAFGDKRLQRRMHNKVFVADNTVAIVGSRNLGNEYFDASSNVNFSDLDMLMTGPITEQVSTAFDEYWNSEVTVPIEAIVSSKPGIDDLKEGQRILQANRERVKDSEYAKALKESDLLSRLIAGNVPVVWAEAVFLWDRPIKVKSSSKQDPSAYLAPRLNTFAQGARSEVLMMSPYLVPGMVGLQRIKEYRDRGVKIKILTNSLASNDVKAAHGGYANYRKEMLRLGVELYEMKPTAGDSPKEHPRKVDSSSKGALHAKTYIVDRELVFVGSFNFDSRSRTLNTEGGIGVQSPEIAAQAARIFEAHTSPDRSYRVTFETESPEGKGSAPEDIRLIWVTEENGQIVRYDTEPMTNFWERIGVEILSWFVPEEML